MLCTLSNADQCAPSDEKESLKLLYSFIILTGHVSIDPGLKRIIHFFCGFLVLCSFVSRHERVAHGHATRTQPEGTHHNQKLVTRLRHGANLLTQSHIQLLKFFTIKISLTIKSTTSVSMFTRMRSPHNVNLVLRTRLGVGGGGEVVTPVKRI